MSDEPLYCPWCGLEIGCGCECSKDLEFDDLPPRESRYCEVCGIIPALGEHCAFYAKGGNRTGCRGAQPE
jgi:hypothetical protein